MKNLKEKGYFAERLYQLRYLVAAVILLCSVLFEISGSSIGFWSVLLTAHMKAVPRITVICWEPAGASERMNGR